MDQPVSYDERELKEIEHAMTYAANWHHGTVGHNMLMLIAKLAKEEGFYLEDGKLMYTGDDDYRSAFIHFGVWEELP